MTRPWSLYILSQLIYLIGLSTSAHSLLPRWLFFVAFTSIAIYLMAYTTFDSPVDNYGLGSFLARVFFDAADFLVFRNPQKEIRMEGQKLGEIENEPLIKRLKWSVMLMMNQRGIGWIDPSAPKVSHLPPASTEGRKALVLAKLREIAFNVMIYDLLGFFYRAMPCFKRDGPSLGEATLLWRLELILGFATGEYLILTTAFAVYCLFSVGLGMSEPHHWRPLFGNILDAYTIRRLWGYTWHQCMRRIFVSHSKFTIKKLHLSPKTALASSIQFLLAFFISGVVHLCGDVMIFRNWTSGGSFTFFMLQPLGIAFEIAIVSVCRKVGIQLRWRISRAIGFVWVLLWFSYTLPIMLDPLRRVGFFQSGPSFSLILGIWRGEWIPKV